MKMRSLAAAALLLGVASAGHALEPVNPPPSPPPNNCRYCIVFFGHLICITTTQPIPGGDPYACQF